MQHLKSWHVFEKYINRIGATKTRDRMGLAGIGRDPVPGFSIWHCWVPGSGFCCNIAITDIQTPRSDYYPWQYIIVATRDVITVRRLHWYILFFLHLAINDSDAMCTVIANRLAMYRVLTSYILCFIIIFHQNVLWYNQYILHYIIIYDI